MLHIGHAQGQVRWSFEERDLEGDVPVHGEGVGLEGV